MFTILTQPSPLYSKLIYTIAYLYILWEISHLICSKLNSYHTCSYFPRKSISPLVSSFTKNVTIIYTTAWVNGSGILFDSSFLLTTLSFQFVKYHNLYLHNIVHIFCFILCLFWKVCFPRNSSNSIKYPIYCQSYSDLC